ncbi:hypothetical protein CASFOL_001512 [Castilleja foliolosa]|uniref:Uncharacterized protein n=1 Tax=Castilleja foliolosa TaxID=1961234 RepID=A0ABD3EJD7_9LAMI
MSELRSGCFTSEVVVACFWARICNVSRIPVVIELVGRASTEVVAPADWNLVIWDGRRSGKDSVSRRRGGAGSAVRVSDPGCVRDRSELF